MQFDSTIKKRKSVRHFTKKRPHWKKIIDAIDAANLNAYAGNHNNLRYVILEEKQNIKNIAKIAEQPWIGKAPAVIMVCSNDTYLEDKYGERGRIYSKQQAGAAIQTIILKLQDLGISSCWVGAFTDEIIKQTFKIPQHYQIEALIPIGYEDKKAKHKVQKKIELENTLNWEVWDGWNRPPLFKEQKDPKAVSS